MPWFVMRTGLIPMHLIYGVEKPIWVRIVLAQFPVFIIRLESMVEIMLVQLEITFGQHLVKTPAIITLDQLIVLGLGRLFGIDTIHRKL
jgi:hypothetical protein